MKRDMNLVREILRVVDSHEHGFAPRIIEIDGYTEKQIGYHVLIMGEANLLVTANVTTLERTSPAARAARMTWKGHEFIDAARDETRWKIAAPLVSRNLLN